MPERIVNEKTGKHFIVKNGIKVLTKTAERYYVWEVLKQELEKYIPKKEEEKEKENVKPQETENK